MIEEYRGYKAHLEFGVYVWYRTTASSTVAKNMKSGKELRAGTRMTRVVTNATNIEEAMKQLDNYLSKPKGEPKMDTSSNLTMDF